MQVLGAEAPGIQLGMYHHHRYNLDTSHHTSHLVRTRTYQYKLYDNMRYDMR